MVDWIHNERPGIQVGFYGITPQNDYWTPVNLARALQNPTDPYYQAELPAMQQAFDRWVAANDLVRSYLGTKVDFTAPDLYTHYTDREGWRLYAQANIAEARKYEGRPVMPYIWMEYHPGSETTLIGQPLPADYWRMELDYLEQHADGAVIFGGPHYTTDAHTYVVAPWDPDAAWWIETQDFISDHLVTPPAA